MDFKKIAIMVLVALGLGYAVGRYVQPASIKIVKEEVIKIVDRINKDVVTIIEKITRPDGTVEEKTTIIDKTQYEHYQQQQTNESTTIVSQKAQWKVQGLAGIRIDDFRGPQIYGVGIERRIIGPVFVGVWGNTDKQVGLSVGLEF